MTSDTLFWIIENTHDHPVLKGYDIAVIELYCDNLDNGKKREYKITGEGVFWLEGADRPLGTLLFISDSDENDESRQRKIDAFGCFTKKRVVIIPVNEQELA